MQSPARGAYLRMKVAVSDLLVQQLPDSALKLWADFLRLVADVEGGQVVSIALQGQERAAARCHYHTILIDECEASAIATPRTMTWRLS